MKESYIRKAAWSGMLGASIGAVVFMTSIREAESKIDPIQHGKYIVNNVAVCTDCHGANLKGAALPFKPLPPIKAYNPNAPNIRGGGVNNLSEKDLVTILSTGKRPGGIPFLFPMPEYKMNKSDATAVARYLKSLK